MLFTEAVFSNSGPVYTESIYFFPPLFFWSFLCFVVHHTCNHTRGLNDNIITTTCLYACPTVWEIAPAVLFYIFHKPLPWFPVLTAPLATSSRPILPILLFSSKGFRHPQARKPFCRCGRFRFSCPLPFAKYWFLLCLSSNVGFSTELRMSLGCWVRGFGIVPLSSLWCFLCWPLKNYIYHVYPALPVIRQALEKQTNIHFRHKDK